MAKYGQVIDFLTYNRLIASIPSLWKIMLKQESHVEPEPVGMQRLPRGMKLSKFCYWEFIRKSFPKGSEAMEAIAYLWQKDLHLNEPIPNWNSLILIPFELTQDTKLRFFQYKCIHRKITTNIDR